MAEQNVIARVLYVTYDGLTDPLGRSQVLPYLAGLAELGHRITVLSCEKPERMNKDGERIRKLCAEAGLRWTPLRYHKRPPVISSVFDAAALQRMAIRLHRKQPFDIVHCRSYIPARAGLGLKRRFGVKFLFDMRGFWPDEKVDGNNWDLGNPLYRSVYRYFKRLESRLLREANHIISLTAAAKVQLLTRPELRGAEHRITVIPCCVDFDHFALPTPEARAAARARLGVAHDEPILLYIGSLGGNYMLASMLDLFQAYARRNSGAHFLLVTQERPESIQCAARAKGIDLNRLIIRSASREEVPDYSAAGDLGVAFRQPSFSAKACSPTKMGEMLALGLPIVANAGVGDVEAIVEDMGCGVAIRDFSAESYGRALDGLESLEGSSQDRRDRALPVFDVKLGVERYDRIYRELSKPTASSA